MFLLKMFEQFALTMFVYLSVNTYLDWKIVCLLDDLVLGLIPKLGKQLVKSQV